MGIAIKICCILEVSLLTKLIFLHADCDAIMLGQTNILLYIFDF